MITIFLITLANETSIFANVFGDYTVTILYCIVTKMFARIKVSSVRVIKKLQSHICLFGCISLEYSYVTMWSACVAIVAALPGEMAAICLVRTWLLSAS